MPTPAERQALWFLATVALLGAGARSVAAHRFDAAVGAALATSHGGEPPRSSELDAQSAAVSAARRERAPRAGRSGRGTPAASVASAAPAPASDEPLLVDPDVADAAELERLPRIGPALAARIVANRDSLGPFGSLAALQRVRGIGPAVAGQLAPHVTFSRGPRP